MDYYPNILLISGTAKNVGKTTLGCNILSYNANKDIIAVKISPHFHQMPSDRIYLKKEETYHISEENEISGKDSSRFFQTGARKVYYIQCRDDSLFNAFEEVLEWNDTNSLYLVESGGLANYIKPGLFIAVTNTQKPVKPYSNFLLADIIVDENIDFNKFARRVVAHDYKWVFDD